MSNPSILDPSFYFDLCTYDLPHTFLSQKLSHRSFSTRSFILNSFLKCYVPSFTINSYLPGPSLLSLTFSTLRLRTTHGDVWSFPCDTNPPHSTLIILYSCLSLHTLVVHDSEHGTFSNILYVPKRLSLPHRIRLKRKLSK